VCQQIIADDKRAPPGLLRWLRLRARSEVRGDSITEICRELGVARTTFYPRTTALALRVVAVRNAHCSRAGDQQGACSHVERM
jgi:hypothetical protein